MKKLLISFTILILILPSLTAQLRIKMQKENGVYTTPCSVNGLQLRFIFDTGASSVCISMSEALFMLKNGYLQESDLKGSSYSQIANGEIVKNTTVNLRELNIGGMKLYNVEAVIIHELSAPLLLGQTAILKLGKIQIEDDELVIINGESPSSLSACLKAGTLINQAVKYYQDKLYDLSADTYQKAYDLCPEILTCSNIMDMGFAFYDSENFLFAIKYLEKAASCTTENQWLYFIYSYLCSSYIQMRNSNKAILNGQKALSYAPNNIAKYDCNFNLGFVYSNDKKYSEAIKYYEISVEFLLKDISFTTNDVMKGKVKDLRLGEIYWNISSCYFFLNLDNIEDKYLIKSALCGNQSAIEFCKKKNLKYEMYCE